MSPTVTSLDPASAEGTHEAAASLRYRKLKNKAFNVVIAGLTLLALMPLFLIIYHVTERGLASLNWEFFTTSEPSPDSPGGGILNSLIGTVLISFYATLIATPISIAAGVYLAFHPKARITEWILLCCNALQSIPAIVVGVIIYIWVVSQMGNFSLISGSIAFAFMMFPIIVISTMEVVSLVSKEIIEAAYAMGATFMQTTFRVVLPISGPALMTGILLALARVTGEAAPILFTAFGNPFISLRATEPVSTLPVTIYKFAISPYENWQSIGWGASLVLLVFIIFVNLLTKTITRHR